MNYKNYFSDVQNLAEFLREHPGTGVSPLIAAVLVSVAFDVDVPINLGRFSRSLDGENLRSVLNVIACRIHGWPSHILSDDELHEFIRKYKIKVKPKAF